MTQSVYEQSELCPVCESDDIDDSVEVCDAICESCGFVISENTDSTSLEWDVAEGFFSSSEDKDWMSECRIRNATDQQLAEAFETLEEFANQLGLSDDLRGKTAEIYCDAFRAEITDGRVTACIIAACLRLASRRGDLPIPMSRLTEFSSVDEKKFHRSHLALCDELDIEPRTPAPSEYVSFLQLELGLTDADYEEVEQLVDEVEREQMFVGKDPAGIAAGGVYLLQEDFTQLDVAKAVGLSTETVRQRVKDLQKVFDDV
ncbi:transcription initiation factor TFIIB [Natronorubrum sediminis]|uniref:Transcription initiation factor TFIIB n=1 Tax=Natronorubrum sediminis TaxID=640943 RepID=A0A1H6FKZ4_9EURY|nr:hypothetical protein [Natronorubrum sediminis]SEH11531.1 transcription initiation factor TFIIB [Natronorubrum sediminis]